MTCKRGHPLKGGKGCDECRRENLLRLPPPGPKPPAATAPRQVRRRSNAFLTRRQVLAAHKLYEAGMSSYELAALGWRQWGYANPDVARRKLLQAFKLDGLPTRTRSEALVLRHGRQSETCGRCGCPKSQRTRGCTACTERHFKRKRSGLPYVPLRRGKPSAPVGAEGEVACSGEFPADELKAA